jgi:hypothetical protein
VALHDLLPEEQLREVENLYDFAGILVFDKWTCNTNRRPTVFFYEEHGSPGQQEALQRGPGRLGAPGSRAQMRSYCQQVFRHAGL